MKKQLSKELNQVKDAMIHDKDKASNPETKDIAQTYIDQIDQIDKKFGVNTDQDKIYRLESVGKTSKGLLRARTGWDKRRKGFYIGNADAVKQYMKEHPDVVFSNLSRFGIKP